MQLVLPSTGDGDGVPASDLGDGAVEKLVAAHEREREHDDQTERDGEREHDDPSLAQFAPLSVSRSKMPKAKPAKRNKLLAERGKTPRKKTRTNRSEDEKRKLIAAWKASGLTQRQFENRNGITAALIGKWNKQYSDAPAPSRQAVISPPPSEPVDRSAAVARGEIVSAGGWSDRTRLLVVRGRLEGKGYDELSALIGRKVHYATLKSLLDRHGPSVARAHGLPWPPVALAMGRATPMAPGGKVFEAIADALRNPSVPVTVIGKRHGLGKSTMHAHFNRYRDVVAAQLGSTATLTSRPEPESHSPENGAAIVQTSMFPPSSPMQPHAHSQPPQAYSQPRRGRPPSVRAEFDDPPSHPDHAEAALMDLKDKALAQALRERDAFKTVFEVFQRERAEESRPPPEFEDRRRRR